MSTQTQTSGAGDGVAQEGRETLTVTDNRTGENYEIEIKDGTVRAMDLRQIKVDEDDFGLMTYDPAFTNTASCRSSITYIDGDAGHPRVPRLSDRAAGGALDVPRGRLPARQRRAADPGRARRVDARDHHPHVRARERQGLHAGLPPRRAPDGDAARLGRRAVDVLPRRQPDPGPRQPASPDDPADRQDADARGVRLPPHAGHALRLSGQRPALRRQLPEHDVQDDRAEVRAGSAARAGARHPVHPPRRPRAERVDERGPRRRLDAGRPVLGGRRRRRRALRPAARRRQRGGAADAAPDREPRRTSPSSSRA